MAKSNREMLTELLAAAQEDQQAAICELHEYLASPEAQDFIGRIRGFQDRTLPGGHHDQVLSGLLRIVESVQNVAATTFNTRARLAEMASTPVEPLPVIEADPPVEADPATHPEAQASIEPDAPVPADTVGGEVE